jgi:hypothetical protein
MSDDGQYLYASLAGAGQVARVNLATFTAGPVFAVGTGSFSAVLWAEDIAVVPGAPTSVAVARHYTNSTGQGGVAIYDNGVRRATVTSDFIPVSNQIEFLASGTTLYGGDTHSTSADFQVMTLSATGVTVTSNTGGLLAGYGHEMVAAGDRLFTSSGTVIRPSISTTTIAGQFTLDVMNSYFVRPDPANNRVHFLAAVNIDGSTLVSRLSTFDATTYGPTATLTVPQVPGATGPLTRWSTDGLAFPAADKLVLVRTNLVGP